MSTEPEIPLPDGWTEEPYEVEDSAPIGDPDHDCTGEDDDSTG